MQTNYCSSLVLLGAVLALLAGCGGKTEEKNSASNTNAASGCKPANVEEHLAGPTWTVDNAWCDTGCDHTHLHKDNTFTFTKSGANFDVHGTYETSGGALAPIAGVSNEVRGKIPTPHASGGETEHWFAAQLYVEKPSDCNRPIPYDLKVAVCKDMPSSYQTCESNKQHGGYAHSHP